MNPKHFTLLKAAVVAAAFAFPVTSGAGEDKGHGADKSHGSGQSHAAPAPSSGSKFVRSAPAQSSSASHSAADTHSSPAKSSHATTSTHATDNHAPAAAPAAATVKPAPAHDDHAATEPADPTAVWNDLVQGNVRFVAGKNTERELLETRTVLAQGQHPKAIVHTCADSRLSPEIIFDRNLGEIFVVRTAGNVADPVVIGSIEYAVDHLGASVIVVMGHEKCGAVAAAASGQWMPSKNLHDIVTRIEPALFKAAAAGQKTPEAQVQFNALQAASDLTAGSPILADAQSSGKIKIVPAYYRLASGLVTPIDPTGSSTASGGKSNTTSASAAEGH